MPTPDGREWLSPQQIAEGYLWLAFMGEFQDEPWFDHDGGPRDFSPFKERVCRALVRGYRATGYQQEFKLVRLFEKFKDACQRRDIPDVGTDTTANLQTMFTSEVLDMLDEDGELI
jgi:hypothetical protein